MRSQDDVAQVTQPRLHSRGYAAKVTQPRLRCPDYTAEVKLPKLRRPGYVAQVSQLLVTLPSKIVHQRLHSRGDIIEDPQNKIAWAPTLESLRNLAFSESQLLMRKFLLFRGGRMGAAVATHGLLMS